jgi:hypothetical protein
LLSFDDVEFVASNKIWGVANASDQGIGLQWTHKPTRSQACSKMKLFSDRNVSVCGYIDFQFIQVFSCEEPIFGGSQL